MTTLLFGASLLAACAPATDPPIRQGLPTEDAISALHVMNHLADIRHEQPPAADDLRSVLDSASPAQHLLLGLMLAASAERGAEAPPFLVSALSSDRLEWTPDGRALTELLLRRTRAEHHHRTAREAADQALASERVKRRELETTLAALRRIDREMSHEERE